MLFIGQTGTGKTEMAKALARFYSSSKKLKTFTLGNFLNLTVCRASSVFLPVTSGTIKAAD